MAEGVVWFAVPARPPEFGSPAPMEKVACGFVYQAETRKSCRLQLDHIGKKCPCVLPGWC